MKYFLAIALFVATVSNGIAQFQFGGQLGINLPASGVALPGFIEVDRDGTQHALIATLGAGVNFNGMVGYQLNPNVVATMDFGYFKGFQGSFHAYLEPGTDAKMDIGFTGKYTYITPGLTIQATKVEGKIQPFARFGLIIGGASVKSTETPSDVPGLFGQSVSKYSGGTSLGLLGAIGGKKALNFRTDIVVELNFKSLTAKPKTMENLQNFEGMEKRPTTTYVETLSPNSPATQALAMTLPFSSFGLSVGVIYQLTK